MNLFSSSLGRAVVARSISLTLLLAGDAPAEDEIPSVEIDGDVAITSNLGDVHFLTRIGCSFEITQTLGGTSPYNVAISGDVAAGSDFSFTNPKVDVYERTNGTWAISQAVQGTGATSSFGGGLAVADGILVVGDSGHLLEGQSIGAVHVFRKVEGTWTEIQIVTPSSISASLPFFGGVVDFDGQTLVVGSYGQDRVFVFDWNGAAFTQAQVLSASAEGAYGFDVAVEGDVLAVGNVDDGSGRVHVFERVAGTWTEAGSFAGSQASSYQNMGWSVAVADGRVHSTVQAFADGAPTYTFEKVGGVWTETLVTLSDSGSQANIAASGSTLMIGQCVGAGVTLPEDYALFADTVFVTYGVGCTGGRGFVPRLRGCGEPATGGTVSIEITNGPGGAVGLLAVGMTEVNLAIGSGCTQLAGPGGVLLPIALFGAGAGQGNLVVHAVVPPVPAAFTAHLQAFLQDVTPLGFSTTNGLRFAITGS